jgi:hypothetical protein
MKKNFTPLLFLASLGAGGLAVSGFAFLNYTVEHGAGLVYITQIFNLNSTFFELIKYRFAELVMIVFTIVHLFLTAYLLKFYIPWLKTEEYKQIRNNPLKNSALVAPIISFAMTMNVLLSVVRYFIPSLALNLQIFMLPGFLVWLLLWLVLMKVEISLLKISFTQNFDVSKINFGWLLHPFALGMVTVTGMGIAAMAKDYTLASSAALLSLISGTMGLFLLTVKLVSLFKSHITAPGLPEKQFLPSFLIVVPNITLYAIAFFRFGHYMEKQLHFEMGYYFVFLMILAFAFEIWYLAFGIALLKDYFKNEMKNKFHITQWGLVCPFVAFAVLSTFVHNLFMPLIYFNLIILITILATSILFFYLLFRHIKCLKEGNELNCILK